MNYERENIKQDKQHPQRDDTKAVPVSIWFTLLAIFVPTTDEYIALKWAKAYEAQHFIVLHEHKCMMPSDSDKNFIKALIKEKKYINNHQPLKSAHNEK